MTYAIGMDIGGTSVKIGLVHRSGRLEDCVSVPTDGGAPPLLTARRACDAVRRWKADIRWCGIGVPGFLNRARTVLLSSPNLPRWRKTPLHRLFSRMLGLPVAIENDANLAAYGEYVAGAGRGCHSVVLLTLGTGIGGGIVLNDTLWTGSRGLAAEVGHIPVVPDGRLCGCGKRGCVEQYASAGALVRQFRRNASAKEVFDAARRGVRPAVSAVRVIAQSLARSIGTITAILDPERIILSGGMSEAGTVLLNAVRHDAKELLPVSYPPSRIVRGALGNRAGMIGAALWAVNHRFSSRGRV